MRKHWIIATLIAMVLLLSVKTDAFAKNDDFARAETISLNTAVPDNLTDSSDDNYYIFTLPADGYISCTFAREYQNNSNDLWELYVYNSDKKDLLYDSFNGITTTDTTLELGLAKGIYYAHIKPYSSGDSYHSTANYSLTVNYKQSSDWEKEENDSNSKSTQIGVNKKIYGSSADNSDDDYYSFILNEDGYISISFDRPFLQNNNKLWQLYVYDSDENPLLYYCFDGITLSDTTAELGLKEGYYLLEIEPYSSGDKYNSSATYNFTINYKASKYWEKEKNDSTANANSINIDETYYGSTVNGSDDYYVFSVNSTKNLSFVFNHPNVNNINKLWIATIYDSDNKRIANYEYNGITVTTKGDYIRYTPGYYYVCIEQYSSSDSYRSDKTYSFSMESMIDVTGIKLSANTLTLKTGESAALTAEVIPANASIKTVNWSSSNPNVASVSGGVVTGWNVGKATIYAKSWDGVVSAACEVTVYSTIKTIGKITYDFNNETSEATVVGVKSTSKIKIPGTVKNSGRSYKVTAIAKNAMKNNKKITELDIADSVRSIGDNACLGCSKLKVVKLNGNNIVIGKNAFKKIKKKATFKIKAKTKSKAKTVLKTVNKKGGAKNAKLKHIKG